MINPEEENSGRGEFLQKLFICRGEMVLYFFLSQIWVFLFFFTGVAQYIAIGLYLLACIVNTISLRRKWKQTLPDF